MGRLRGYRQGTEKYLGHRALRGALAFSLDITRSRWWRGFYGDLPGSRPAMTAGDA